jgi:eukaryotic-like serine/threonine-protein kinase
MPEKPEKRRESWPGWTFAAPVIALGLVFMTMVASNVPFERLIPVTTLLIVMIVMSPFWLWIRNRHELEKKKIDAEKQSDELPKRYMDRLENLEAILCRLDLELNRQMERSMNVVNSLVQSNPGFSQLNTTILDMSSALEGRFQILKELGRGGMGVVFQAYDKQLNEQVAIKMLSPLIQQEPEALERLRREVSAARRITHPNVIRIHDLSEAKGLHYVSMEYFAGKSLKEYLREHGKLSAMEATQIAYQILDGVEAAHSQGIIHRDLKSQNVLINSNGHLKIIDFGLARTSYVDGMTATGLILGTPEYMSPEQVAGKKADERSDIYSIGIILYELFAGRVPFKGETAIGVGFQQLKDDPQPPRELNPQISEQIQNVILKALEKSPEKRFANVAELRESLRQATGAASAVPKAQTQAHQASESLRLRGES